ncbi:MAG: imidazolonepropionase [Campylobacteraceae bacterium]|nr:imidazolonepropionase [Campylobacteraceae bacterium]
MEEFDKVWINARITIINGNNDIEVLENSFLAVKNKKIAKIDKMSNFTQSCAKDIYDVKNRLISTSLIDCHTHLVYAGNRTNEFEDRLNGVSYKEIAANGGGIASSIKSLRASSFDELYEESQKRLITLIQEGVTTIEIKTGYGLDLENETKMLKVAQKLEENYPIHIEKTFLAAHAVPPEYKNETDAYIDYICDVMFEQVNDLGLITCVDAYCEHLAFSVEQVKKVFDKAMEYNLKVKLHAEQFSSMGASDLACEYNALSVDHLEFTEESTIINMQKSGTVAVLLPGAYYFLRETQKPPIELLRKYNVPIAIASDLNPGTSSLCSLLLMMNMAAVMFSLKVDEVFLGVTKNAAKALNLQNSKGELKVGFDADFCIWDISHPRDLVCSYNPRVLHYSVFQGEKVNV